MRYKVKLKFFQDDATGDWGVAHSNSIDLDNGSSFNAFWNGIGIFHDVFEHYFEGVHKYFSGENAFNIGGEVAAMGHLTYIWEQYRLQERLLNPNSYYSFETNIVRSTTGEMIDAIKYGNYNFGDKLLCGVPKQKDTNSYLLSTVITEHLYLIDEAIPDRKEIEKQGENFERCKEYKDSITDESIERLYTWGYLQAEKNIPNSKENLETLINFINFWNSFCKYNEAEHMANYFKYLEFTITTGEKMKWSANFITNYGEKVSYKKVENFEPAY